MPQIKQATPIIWRVFFTQSAEADLTDILDFVAERDGSAQAKSLLALFQQSKKSLAALPLRGHCPPELARMHIANFREIHAGVYRIIYQIAASENCVFIHAILDSRRHVAEVLHKRLLRGHFL